MKEAILTCSQQATTGDFFPSLISHFSIYHIAFRRCSFKELKEKKALQALDSFHALCANTVKPTSSPQSVGKGRLRQPKSPALFQKQWAGPNLPKETPRVLFAGGALSSLESIWIQRPPAPRRQPLPPSCLFCSEGTRQGK